MRIAGRPSEMLRSQLDNFIDSIHRDGCETCGGPVTVHEVSSGQEGLTAHVTCNEKPEEACEYVKVRWQ